jgi:enoyl-[acyl-carrier protein] reductase II
LAMVEGDVENGTIMAGQICAMVKQVQPVRDIINDIAGSAGEVIRLLEGQFS